MNSALRSLRSSAGRILRALGVPPRNGRPDPQRVFHEDYYLRHNQRRLEHLASLGLPLAGATVLEVAAGIGDHTSFFLDRGCHVVSTEGRPENLAILRSRYPGLNVRHLDLDHPVDLGRTFDVVYCYGCLYHLSRPGEALAFMAKHCQRILLLETRVFFGDREEVTFVQESARYPSDSIVGRGCRPTRSWVYRRLGDLFPFVYLPQTQPNHFEFPTEWTAAPPPPEVITRAIFVAARQPLHNPLLTQELLQQQLRQP